METIDCEKHGTQPTYRQGRYKKLKDGTRVFYPKYKCRECHKEYVKASYRRNPKAQKHASRKYYHANKRLKSDTQV